MPNSSVFRRTAFAFVLAACLASHANAGLLSDDEARKAVLALSAKVDDSLREIGVLIRETNARIDTKGDKAIGLEMVNQYERTLQEMASLRGQLELLTHQIANAQKNQNDLYANLDARIRKFEQGQDMVDGRAGDVAPAEKTSYESAMDVFKAGDYKGAATALLDFMRRSPHSTYAADAQYWLGNAYFAQGNYKNAIAAHETVVARYGDSPNAPDAMLNIAASFLQLNDKKNARKTLQQVISTYAASNAANIARERLAQQK